MTRFTGLMLLIWFGPFAWAQQAVSGFVTDNKNGEVLIGVSVYTPDRKTGTVTNAYGYFALQAKPTDTLVFSYLGYRREMLAVNGRTRVDMKLDEASGQLKEVEIRAGKIKTQAAGMHRVDLKQLSLMPAMGGERDLLKTVQLMPGVKKGAYGTSGILVRGGNNDQNLILLDDAPVYNPSHLFGFFSLFNTDALKDATLQTGGFTANYGGRLSSVLDVRMNDGNNQQLRVDGNVGMLASRLGIQGPAFGNKGSFLIAGRISYLDKLFRVVGKDMPSWFYDLNAKIRFEANKHNQFLFSIYQGDDVLDALRKDTGNQVAVRSNLGNTIASFRWNHAFRNPLRFSNLTLFTSRYRYWVNGSIGDSKMSITAGILDYGVRYQFLHELTKRVSLNYGMELINHQFLPARTTLTGSFNENLTEGNTAAHHLTEGAVYGSANIKLTRKLNATLGMRYSAALAAQTLYRMPEPRASFQYQLTPKGTLTLSYATMVQYMFQLSGSSAVMPTEMWYGVTRKIRPQQAEIFTLGYNHQSGNYQGGVDVYYKPMKNLVEYRDGSVNLVNNNPDEIIVQGTGEAYGAEWQQQYHWNQFDFRTAYTLSWTNRTFSEINDGKTFNARYDRRHDLSASLIWKPRQHLTFSAVWTYASGSWFTPVIGRFMMPNANYTGIDLLPIYTARNAVQLASSHKLDVHFTYSGKTSRYQYAWHIGAYNVYNQTQPYRIKADLNANGTYTYKQVGLFGFIPSIAYQFNF